MSDAGFLYLLIYRDMCEADWGTSKGRMAEG